MDFLYSHEQKKNSCCIYKQLNLFSFQEKTDKEEPCATANRSQHTVSPEKVRHSHMRYELMNIPRTKTSTQQSEMLCGKNHDGRGGVRDAKSVSQSGVTVHAFVIPKRHSCGSRTSSAVSLTTNISTPVVGEEGISLNMITMT